MKDKDAGITSNEVAPVVERTVTGQWLPGHAKRGGRKPGVKNWNARAIAEAAGFDAIQILQDVVLTGYLPLIPGEDPKNRKKLSNELRLKAASELAQYTYPKLSATQVTGNEGGPVAVATVDVTALMDNPATAEAAQLIALAMASQQRKQIAGNPDPAPNTIDDYPGAGAGPRR